MTAGRSDGDDRGPLFPWREGLFWYVMFLGLLFGAAVNFMPPLFPAFKSAFGASYEQLGRSQLVFFVGGLAFSVGGGWFSGVIGLRRASAAAITVVGLGILLLAQADSLAGVYLGGALAGVGNVGVLVVCGAILTARYPRRRQGVFVFWGLTGTMGASAGPALTGQWIVFADKTGLDWQLVVYVYAFLFLATGLWGFVLRSRHDAVERTESAGVARSLSIMSRVIRSPAFYASSLWAMLHALAQLGMASWIGQVFQARHGLDAAQAAYFLTANALGFFSARVVLSWYSANRELPELTLLGLSGLGSSVFFVATIMSGSYEAGLLLFYIAGAATAGNGPAIQSYVGYCFGAQAATALALINGLGNVGAASGPYIIGLVGETLGLETGIWLMPGFMVLLSVTAFIWRRRSRDTHTAPQSFDGRDPHA